MNTRDYEKLMTELCETVGLASMQSVIDSQHVVVDGTTVGMVFDEKIARDLIFVYFDLGALPPGRESEIQLAMLKSNLKADRTAMGHFGIHPTNGNAVYHVRLNFLPDFTGKDVAQLLRYHVSHLKNWTERLLASSKVKNAKAPVPGFARSRDLMQWRI